MRKKLKYVLGMLAVIIGSFMLASCSNNEDDTPQSHQLTININIKDNELSLNNINDLKIAWSNDKGQKDTVNLTQSSTTITVLEGQYQLIGSGKVKDEAAAYVSGKSSVDVFGDASVNIDLEKIVESPLIFKSIYTTGGKQAYVYDSYFEIVNNSDEVQYLDGLMVIAKNGAQTKANAWQAAGITDLYNSGQGAVIAFPGTGKQYPLKPGQSIVLANDAKDHHTDAGDGNNCPDLSKADWEVYLDYITSDIDNPAPNVNVIFKGTGMMKMFGYGIFGGSYILARCPEGMTPEEFAANKSNLQTTPGSTSKTEFLMIPSKYVLDAVDIWNSAATERYGFFLAKDDAQGVLASVAQSGKCVRRKVTKIANGRAYYQDTNNSANDFLTNQPLTPGQTPTEVDK